MANFGTKETLSFDDVYIIEEDDFVQGQTFVGGEIDELGTANLQQFQLTNRTDYLKDMLDALDEYARAAIGDVNPNAGETLEELIDELSTHPAMSITAQDIINWNQGTGGGGPFAQSDWAEDNPLEPAFIKNKPDVADIAERLQNLELMTWLGV